METKVFRLALRALLLLFPFLATDLALAADTNAQLSAYIAALNANMPPHANGAAIAALFTPDGVQIHPNGPVPGDQHGRAELEKFFQSFKERYADWTHVELSRMTSGNRAMWEGTAQGHDASGKPLKLPIVFLLKFDEAGKVTENRVYVDVHLRGDPSK